MPTTDTDPDYMRILAQERLLLAVTEVLEERRISRTHLAAALRLHPQQLSHRFSGKLNLTLRDVADMFHVLGVQVQVSLTPDTDHEPGCAAPLTTDNADNADNAVTNTPAADTRTISTVSPVSTGTAGVADVLQAVERHERESRQRQAGHDYDRIQRVKDARTKPHDS